MEDGERMDQNLSVSKPENPVFSDGKSMDKVEDLGFSEAKSMDKVVDMCGEGLGFDSGARLGKKARVECGDDMKRIAEIVMVLSALGEVRSGRSPSVVERGLMAEAREKLALICEGIAPKDLFPRDAVRVLIEDLGLNRWIDQRIGYRPHNISIADKVWLAKRKMELSKEFTAQPATNSSQLLQAGFGTNSESLGAFFHAGTAHRFPLDKPTSMPLSTGGFQPSSPAVPVYSFASTSLLNRSQVNEAQLSNIRMPPASGSSEGVPSPLAVPRAEAVHFRLDAQSNGPSYLAKVRASSSGDHLVEKAPTLASSKSPSLTVAKVGQAISMSDHTVNPFQPQAIRDNDSKSSVVQTAPGDVQKALQGTNFVLAPSLFTIHNDIAKNVQKILQPRPPDHPNWTIPPIDYMNKPLTCQICKVSINDVENLLVCDACEKGVHLKCLQSFNQKGIPKGEWHCPKCLTMSNGKPLPPKYGRVSRAIGTSKVSSNTTEVRAFPEKKMEISDQKVNHHKIIANGNHALPISAQVASTGNNHIESAPDLKMPNVGHSYPARLTDNGIDALHESQVSCEGDAKTPGNADVSENQMHEISEVEREELKIPSDLTKGYECKPGYGFKREDLDGTKAVSNGNLDSGNGSSDCSRSSSEDLHNVEWVGGVLKVADERTYYESCCIDGIVYKLQDFALFRSNNNKLSPSKLQVLWEDSKTSSKWAIVNRCYFPDDLPEVVGRPCTPEYNEVYESNHGSTIMAGLIHGRCEVIPPNKYKEEFEKRIHVGHGANYGLHPIFLCKWFYDESRGLFQPVTD
ncbi:uncharacterized protein LOC143851249 [Tasmannia lanceolata]|uniref:uncharacterized protein LOC143851249 n=1 Tax=Tasmannia lanceolata TaxID=3420 RepID=UPI0040627E76